MGIPDAPFLLDAPDQVQQPTASDSYTSASVNWTAPSDTGGLPVTGYTVSATDLTDSARGGQSTSVPATATSATFTGLTPGDSYTFTVTPSSLLGSGLSATTASVSVLASAAQIEQSLTTLGHPTLKDGLKAVRKHGLILSYAALEPGTVSVRWYYATRRHHHRFKLLVASATGTASSAQTLQLHIELNRTGRRLAKKHKHLRLTELLSFTPAGGQSTVVTSTLTLR